MSDTPAPHAITGAFFDRMADDRRRTASEPFVADPPIVTVGRIEPLGGRNGLLVAEVDS